MQILAFINLMMSFNRLEFNITNFGVITHKDVTMHSEYCFFEYFPTIKKEFVFVNFTTRKFYRLHFLNFQKTLKSPCFSVKSYVHSKTDGVAFCDLIDSMGRELHKALEVKTKYTDWFKRMCEYDFTENSDFVTVLKNEYRADGAIMPQKSADHQLTIPMANLKGMIKNERKQNRSF